MFSQFGLILFMNSVKVERSLFLGGLCARTNSRLMLPIDIPSTANTSSFSPLEEVHKTSAYRQFRLNNS